MILDTASAHGDIIEVARQILQAGAWLFQYRDKLSSRRGLFEQAVRLSGLSRAAGTCFIVNDHVDIALAVQADGVHIGQDDLSIETARRLMGDDKVIGVSTHTLEQAIAAEAAGADYVGFGPIFETATKVAGPVLGVEELRRIRRSISIPVVAIGGIDSGNAPDVIAAGADGIAVAGAILRAGDVGVATRSMLSAISGKLLPRRGIS